MFLDCFKYKKTNFESGGCIIEDIPMGSEVVDKAKKFIAPRKIDLRDMLISSSNQGETHNCVGYSTAGCCEFWHWKKKHYPLQFDGDAIYKEAKKIDGSPHINGTWIRYGVQASINLGFINGKGKYVPNTINDIKFTLHEHGPFVGGFMITTDWNIVNKKTGLIKSTEGAFLIGAHAVTVCGFSNDGLMLQNSWSDTYGIYGFCILGWEQVQKQFMNGMVIVPN